jgi:hypothetical protein
MTQFKGWDRQDKLGNVTVWKHNSGVRIVRSPATTKSYQLQLFDRHGVEQKDCRMYHPNKEYLERVSAKWQHNYSVYLDKLKEKKR